MKRLLLIMATLLVAASVGCTFDRSGSQSIELDTDPWGWRPADEDSNRIMREASGDSSWGIYSDRPD